jgi:transposase
MNVLKLFKKTAVLTLIHNGISQHEISRKIGIDRKTIRKYQGSVVVGSNSPMATGFLDRVRPLADPVPKEPVLVVSIPKQARSHCEPHHDWMVGEVQKGRNAMAIYQDLVERFGFTHRYNSVKRYVRGLRKKDPEQYDRLEFLPGEEAQVDYGQGAPTIHPKTGKRRRPRLFVMTLRYSRRSFRKTVWNSSKEQWARLHEEAFRYFGGCPRYVVLDNLKEGVLKPDIYEPELNPVFAAMLAHYGVVADPCRVRDPDRKGTVENAIQHTQNTALKGREFKTIEEQNQWLMHWEERWASPRVHGRTKRQVQEMFLEEKPHLKKLPLQSFRYFEQGVRTVWDDGCIEVNRSFYSALPALIGSVVIVRITDLEIEILDKRSLTLLRRHVKSQRPGGVRMEETDRIFNPSRMTEAFLDQAGQIGPKTRELCELLFQEQGRMGQRKMRGILSLARKHEASLIEKACLLAVDRQVRSSKIVRELVERLEDKNKTLPVLVQSHTLIRSLDDYGLFFEKHSEKTTSFNQPGEGNPSPKNKENHHADVTTRDRTIPENTPAPGNPGDAGDQVSSGFSGGLVLPGYLLSAPAGRDGSQEIKTDGETVPAVGAC